ncbi:rab-GTPase-TBC domain-containing protein [Radiomyces spectabilis]|uniref:rab-GTPase-TBC domain-containing protein n=1 Tax=Radiomyces spectabilis TaxID=64574 RepID=UPI00221E3968|nr:rab-GTPase-TBC domain-containing protein [Radiomyces spectabilis]KAI8387981.1 rab-GTPase-TBC domain-containing protein [Radiomyces spectabilis]
MFANARDLSVSSSGSTPKLASCNFVASARSSEALAQSGHLAVSAPSQIIGQFQTLKTLRHPHLCEYVDIHRGKYDRLFTVSEYHDCSLQKTRNVNAENPSRTSIQKLSQWAFEICSALQYLQTHRIVHGCLSPSNILLDSQGRVKLFGYGLFYMTGGGENVDFPIGYPPYLACECLDHTAPANVAQDKRDVWALGIILLEQYMRHSFWTTSDVGLIFDSLMTCAEWSADAGNDAADTLWHHEGIETLDINKSVLTFLQGDFSEEEASDDLKAFHHFILKCLQVSVSKRASIVELLSTDFLLNCQRHMQESPWNKGPILVSDALDPDPEETQETDEANPAKDALQGLPISYIYHLWKLAGGDVELDLLKRGVFLSTPVIERLPRVCLVNDHLEIGNNTTDIAQLYSDTINVLGFKELYQRLEEGRNVGHADRFECDADFFMVVDESEVNFLLDTESDLTSDANDSAELDADFIFTEDLMTLPPSMTVAAEPTTMATPTTPMKRSSSHTAMSRTGSSSSLSVHSPAPSTPVQSSFPKLPLLLREQDVNYQYHRLALFSDLLRQYPASRKEILHHAKVDIPPLLRGKIWAAVLGVRGDTEHAFHQISKQIDPIADRQIEVDVPRCHQYNQLLASSTGHEKLRRLLRAWVSANQQLVYWQGLDSLCAPFLTLNFNDEALAFACLQKFIPKFLNNFFIPNNYAILQEYLAVFRHLLSYHDPELSSHLDSIAFMPDLYAIPWFLTLFTHVFPLDKIYHLWDKLLVGPSSLPLFAGIAILRQIRDVLLSSEFNDCIVLFSESFPKVDIEKCVQSAMSMCKVTPPSLVARGHPSAASAVDASSQPSNEVVRDARAKMLELSPRISVKDIDRILSSSLLLDIRSEQAFSQEHIPSSMNVQSEQLKSYATILRKLNRKHHLVVCDDDEQGLQFASQLVYRHFPQVAVIQGGIGAVRQENADNFLCHCRPQKQTTAGFRGKGSEPPFVIWRCKVPPPLTRK